MAALKFLLVTIVVVAFAVVNDWPVLDQLVAALLALIIGAYIWSRTSLGGVSVERETTTDRTQVGESLNERLEIRNTSRFPKLWLELRDFSTLPEHQVSRVVHVRGRTAVGWPVATPCLRRGRFRVGPLTLRSGDPFGIFPARLSIPAAHELIVYPATVDVSGYPLPVGQLSGGAVTDRKNPFVTPNVSGLRDYVPGDSLNRISWTATARTGRMMVKEFDLDPTADVWLVLDLQRVWHVRAGPPPLVGSEEMGLYPVETWLDSTVEYAVTVAASLARRCIDQGRNAGMIASGAHHEVITPDRSDRQYLKLLESLAVVHADGEQPLAEVLLAESGRFNRQASVIVITASTDEQWVRALVELAGRRVKTAAIVVEASTFGPAESSLLLVSRLLGAGVPTHLVKYGASIGAALAALPGGANSAEVPVYG